jgi:biopolymer transport protein ExbD
MRFHSHNISQDRRIDFIPILNVILLLMFFFLLSWSFVLQPGIEVKLPSSPVPSATQQGRHVITLKASDQNDVLMFFDEKHVNEEGLRAALKTAAEKNPGDWITLNADEKVPSGRVTQAQMLIIQSGFRVTQAIQWTTPKT